MKDIEAVWGDDPTMRHLVSEWGEDVFRASAIHYLAVDEEQRRKKREAEAGKHTRPVKGAKKR